MPKIPITFNSFEKGENTATDPRDLGKGFLAGCVNMMVDEVGIIRTMGAPENHTAQGTTNQPTVTVTAGRGLYAFSHDRLEGEVAGAAAAETSDDYIALMDADSTAAVRIWSKSTAVWGASDVIDLGTTTGVKATFHSFDGGLRVSDGNFGAANKTKWYNYIDRQKFRSDATTPAYTDDNWYSLDNDLANPISTGAFTEDAEGGAFFNFDSSPDAGSKQEVNVKIETTVDTAKPEAEWQKNWECGVTFVYDGTQETLIQPLTGTVDKSGAPTLSKCRFQIQIFSDNATGANAINPRLTHVKVYIKEEGTQEWFIQGVWDLQSGGRLINGDTANHADTFWSFVDTDGGGTNNFTAYNTSGTQPIPQILHTWESETGLFNDEKSIDIGQTGDGYNASVVIGRTVYVGNVKRTNFDGESLVEADAIYKSIPDQPDTFPASWRIDAAINDGEGITALHKWGKELLQFKHRTLYIIDTSGETEILTNTFKKAGARNPAIVTDTPHGIVWANEWGLWLYNGELQNLLVQDSLGNTFFTQEVPRQPSQFTTIEQSTWSSFINSNSFLGYYAYKQQIIIGDDSTATSDGDIYIYDIRTGSMVRGLAKLSGNLKTNFVTDSDDDLVIVHTTGTIVKWGDTETATAGQQVDFPEVGTLGKLFRTRECSVTYKSSATQATPLYYRLNGTASWTAFGTQNFADTGDGTTEGWTGLVFVHGSFLEGETIQLKLDFPSSGIVQTNDITLSVRPLSFKRVS